MADSKGLFDDAWMKWAWARRHGLALEREIARFANDPDRQPVVETVAHYDAKRHAFVVTIASVTPTPRHWGLLLGDCAADYRGALDHLAWALVCRGRTPPEGLPAGAQSGIYFPIVSTSSTDFTTRAARMLPGVRRADLAVVRRYQPYRVGVRKAPWQVLAVLARMNNVDKHRHLQPMPVMPTAGGYEVTEQRHCVITDDRTKTGRRPIEVGAEVGTIRVRKTGPKPQMKVQMHFTAEVALGDLTTVIDWLDKTRDEIAALLEEFSRRPRDLLRDLDAALRW